MEERLARVRELTGGRGADVVVEAAGVPEVVPAAIDLLRPGGLLIEVGNFSDGGEVLLSPHRHLCSKGIRLMGVAGEEPGAYLPAMRQLARHRSAIPAIDRFVSDRFALADADTAMRRSHRPRLSQGRVRALIRKSPVARPLMGERPIPDRESRARTDVAGGGPRAHRAGPTGRPRRRIRLRLGGRPAWCSSPSSRRPVPTLPRPGRPPTPRPHRGQ